MAETAAFLGFVAPGEFTIILGGVLAGRGHALDPAPDRDRVGLVRDRRRDRLLPRPPARARLRRSSTGPRCGSREERFAKVEDFFRKHGGKTIFIGRWLGLVRPLMPFTAGASGMSYRRFLPYDVLGAGLWGATWCLLGYIFWQSFEQVASTAGRGTIAFAILLGAVRRRLPGDQAPAPSRAARRPSRAGSTARGSGPCCARWRAGARRAVWLLRPALALRAAAAVGADRAAAALPRRRASRRASSASS